MCMPVAMLRWICRLTRLCVTVIVIAGISGLGTGSARLVAAAIDMMAMASPSAARAGVGHCLDDDSRAVVELKALESDTDDDDDPMCGFVDVVALDLRCAPPASESDHTRHGEESRDPSRFAAGMGLPRGPPAIA